MNFNQLSSSHIRPKRVLQGAKSASQPDRLTRIMQSDPLGKFCDISSDNPVMAQSICGLAICCAFRPITNFLITPDKKDAGYASAHSGASGVVGFIWPLIIATPIALAVKAISKNPAKFLKPSIIKKFYPSVGMEEIIKDGKKIERVMTDSKGRLLRQDGTLLCRELEPLKLKDGDIASRLEEIDNRIDKINNPSWFGKMTSIFKPSKEKRIEKLEELRAELLPRQSAYEAEKAKFEAENTTLYVDPNGVVRSREVHKTKDGKYQLDKNGEKIGCVVQKDKIPVTEEMEKGDNRQTNLYEMFKWLPDTILAPIRAMLTIACIPLILGVFGIEKPSKNNEAMNVSPKPENVTDKQTNVKFKAKNISKSTFGRLTAEVSSPKKGGV